MTFWLCTNGRPSNGAKALAGVAGFKRCITGKGIKPTDTVINWGSSAPLELLKQPGKVLNQYSAILAATNKLRAFRQMSEAGVKVVSWTDQQDEAVKWYNDGSTVVVRNKLTGHSGDGIMILDHDNPTEEFPQAPLYTKYVFKSKEFRVHVVNGKVADTQQKIKDPEREVITWKVRSHANGFMFVRNNIAPDTNRDELAIAAIKALAIDFGAVDIIQDKKGNLYVLEVNTAPGLEGQTVQSYAKAFLDGN